MALTPSSMLPLGTPPTAPRACAPGNAIPCDGRDLRAAITAVLAGEAPSSEQIASIGCNIKWHPL